VYRECDDLMTSAGERAEGKDLAVFRGVGSKQGFAEDDECKDLCSV
jgi:hypothetical protein